MRITLEKLKCIGCGTCVSLCEKFFEMAEDGTSHLKNSKRVGESEELEIAEPNCAKDAAEACPVQCIHIV